jgi:hypothetical protein
VDRCEHLGLDSSKVLRAHQRLVRLLGAPYPVLPVVPSQLGLVTRRNVIHVQEDFITTLTIPHLIPGVLGIAEDGPHRLFLPSSSAAVTVPGRVVGRRARDTVAVESFGDGEISSAGQVFGEDALDNGCRSRVHLKDMPHRTHCRLTWVRVGARVGQSVAVRRSTTEEAAPVAYVVGLHDSSYPSDLDSFLLEVENTTADGGNKRQIAFDKKNYAEETPIDGDPTFFSHLEESLFVWIGKDWSVQIVDAGNGSSASASSSINPATAEPVLYQIVAIAVVLAFCPSRCAILS